MSTGGSLGKDDSTFRPVILNFEGILEIPSKIYLYYASCHTKEFKISSNGAPDDFNMQPVLNTTALNSGSSTCGQASSFEQVLQVSDTIKRGQQYFERIDKCAFQVQRRACWSCKFHETLLSYFSDNIPLCV